ncbi:hypothetical protein BDV18DRAFT_135781 [Aspergillus unguis]
MRETAIEPTLRYSTTILPGPRSLPKKQLKTRSSIREAEKWIAESKCKFTSANAGSKGGSQKDH